MLKSDSCSDGSIWMEQEQEESRERELKSEIRGLSRLNYNVSHMNSD